MNTMENTTINDTRQSPHFKLGEFLNLSKYAQRGRFLASHREFLCYS